MQPLFLSNCPCIKEYMKSVGSIFIAMIVFFFVSCDKEPVSLNENYIPVNKCQSYNQDGEKLTLCLDSIVQDSRCPINAVCIWQGVAVARFTVDTKNNDHVIELATAPLLQYKKDTIVAGFKIELINIAPHPEMGKPLNYDEYVAEVKVSKQ